MAVWTNVTSWDEVPVVIDAAFVARILRLSQRAVTGKMIAGEIPGKKVGNTWRVSRDQFRSWLEGAQ